MDQKGLSSIISVIVGIIVLGIAGYFVSIRTATKSISAPDTDNQQTTLIPMTADDQKDWATFTHPNDGYSIRYPADRVLPSVSTAGDSGSGWIWSADVGYIDALGTVADVFVFSGSIDDAVDAYYRGNQRIQVTSTHDTTIDVKPAKVILFRDMQHALSPIGKQYFIQYQEKKVLIVSGLLDAEVLFDKVVTSLHF